MIVKSVVFLFFYVVLLALFAKAEDELVFVNVIYRHGDRTPVDTYPNDPYRNNSYWPTGFGQLTNTGKTQHFELGQWFRQRYSGFLPKKYSSNDIYIRSTDVDRTLMSAESNLAGLYGPIGSDLWKPDLKWQPIPVHTIPEKSDPVLSAKKPCPRYEMLLNKLMQTPEFRRIDAELQQLYEYVSNHTGKHINTIQLLEYLYNALFIETLYGFKLPEWTRAVFPQKLTPWANFAFVIKTYTPQLQRLKVGLLVNEIMTRFRDKSRGSLKPNRKFWVYSAHDITIANVLMAFGAFEPHCPPYRSTIILEMRRSNQTGFYLNVFYKNETTPRAISILGCDLSCPLDQAFDLLKPILIDEKTWDVECQTLSGPLVSTIATFAVVTCAILLLILLVALCVGAAFSKQPQHHRNQCYQPLRDEIN